MKQENMSAFEILDNVSYHITHIRNNMEVLERLLTKVDFEIDDNPEQSVYDFTLAMSLFETIMTYINNLTKEAFYSVQKLQAENDYPSTYANQE